MSDVTVTIDEDPQPPKKPTVTDQLLRDTEKTVTDARGRKLTFRRPDVLAQYQIVEAMGDAAANTTLMQMVNPLVYLAAIDEEDIFLPANRREVDALLKKLGHEGTAELNAYYFDVVIKPLMDAAEAAKQQERLKN